ncbi:hypothetical protein BN1723_010915 [Verticillium longisporum]|uniref:Uncharacterized protein n=1 Tax=Verticillium longisporum TaxID=100787 RepID=A0A0G4L2M2_VERLO|nr:hypothetical protein BN1723_010915 [Verticillium longisporum]
MSSKSTLGFHDQNDQFRPPRASSDDTVDATTDSRYENEGSRDEHTSTNSIRSNEHQGVFVLKRKRPGPDWWDRSCSPRAQRRRVNGILGSSLSSRPRPLSAEVTEGLMSMTTHPSPNANSSRSLLDGNSQGSQINDGKNSLRPVAACPRRSYRIAAILNDDSREITHPKRMAIILDVLFEAANLKTPLESPKPTITWSFCQRLSLHASILYHSQLQALWVTQRSLIKDPTGLITTLLCWTRQTILHALLSLASWRYLGISGRRLPANVVVGGRSVHSIRPLDAWPLFLHGFFNLKLDSL